MRNLIKILLFVFPAMIGTIVIGAVIIAPTTLPEYLDRQIGCVLDADNNWVSFDLKTGEYHIPILGETRLADKTATSTPLIGKNRYIGKTKDAPCVFWDGKVLKDYSDAELNVKVLKGKAKRLSKSFINRAYAAIQFNARTDQVDFGDNYDFSMSSIFTLELWANITSTADCGIVWSKFEVSGAPVSWDIIQNCSGGTGNIDFRIGDVGSANRTECRWTNGGSALDDGLWHHLAATYNGAAGCVNVRGYVDGVSQSVTQDFGGSTTGTHGLSMTLGAEAYGSQNQSVVGSLDEARIWNYVRTADLIAGNMWLRITDEPGLIGYWRLDEGVNSIVYPYGSHTSSTNVTGAFDSVGWTDSAPINYRE